MGPKRTGGDAVGVLAGVAVALAGCATTPLPTLPPEDLPGAWRAAEGRVGAWPDVDWWLAFESDELADLMARVEARNLDLRTNERDLRMARLALIDAGLDRWPAPDLTIGASGSYVGSRRRGGNYGDGGSESADLSLGANHANLLDARPRHDIATARFASSVARAADIRLRTLATAASAYFQLLLLHDRMAAARLNLARAEVIEGIVQARVDVGLALASDGLRQRIVTRRERNALRTLSVRMLGARSALALMVGESLWDFDVEATTLAEVRVPAAVPGLPSELLVRRPDIVQAEAALREARANVDLARLAFLPRISLTSSANAASTSLSDLLGDGVATLAATSNTALKLFDGGRRRRGLEASRLRLESLLDSYRRTVIAAFNEVEVALADLDLLGSLSAVLDEDVALAEESLRIAEARYREGVQGFETLLNAQTTLYATRNARLDNKLARLRAVVDLHLALGGGWRGDADWPSNRR